MKDWHKTVLSRAVCIREAIAAIDSSALQVALIVDSSGHLEGVVNDGDVRRGLLRGVSLDEPVELIMTSSPQTCVGTEDPADSIKRMSVLGIRHLPVVDGDGLLVGLRVLDELLAPPKRDNVVVLMAGGQGSRLRPLTESCPKPLLTVGQKPILETIIETFKSQGFGRFLLSVNYKAHMIEGYFGDGSRFDVHIDYLRETEPLGTAGALGNMSFRPDLPFVVMNGDILTKLSFSGMLDFHTELGGKATMCVRPYTFQMPFGLVNVSGHTLKSIEEKPSYDFLVNAGIYVLSPEALDYVPKGQRYDMTTLFADILADKGTTLAFPVREYWLDIGRISDYNEANRAYDSIFSSADYDPKAK